MKKRNSPSFKTTEDAIEIPMPPEAGPDTADEMAVYAWFMRHLRHVPNNRMAIKILSTIQFTADMLGFSDEHVAKTLVELGLRAPRMAFPAAFLEYADQALMRSGWEIGGPSNGLQELKTYWDHTGEDKFAHAKRGFRTLAEEAFI